MTWIRKIKQNLGLFIFGGVFAGVGLGFLGFGLLPALKDWAEMRHWVPVQAQVTNGGYHVKRGDDSTTYKAYGQWRYRVDGQEYTGSRVAIFGGSDNIGDFQQALGNRLARAESSGRRFTVFVDPGQPSRSIANRDMRIEMVLFRALFALVFGGVGTAIVVWSLMRSADTTNADAPPDKPWLNRSQWASAEVPSLSKAKMWMVVGFASFWNLIALPTGVICVNEIREGNTAAYVGLIFPVVGAALALWAKRCWAIWRRFGLATLHLDPYPGALGGQVGGTLMLATRMDNSHPFDVALYCLRSYVSGTGKNRSRKEKVVWKSRGYAHGHATPEGFRLECLFDVPAELPQSEEPSDDYHLWRLWLGSDLPGVDLDLEFELPVFATGEQSARLTQLSSAHPLAGARRHAAIESSVVIRQIARGLECYSPAGKHPWPKLAGLVFGSAFFGCGLALPGWGAPLLMAAVFAGVGGVIALVAGYSLLLSVNTQIDSDSVASTKYLAGLRIGHSRWPRERVRRFRAKLSFSSGQGARAKSYYKLQAESFDGEIMDLALNLEGADVANELRESIELLTGMVPAGGEFKTC